MWVVSILPLPLWPSCQGDQPAYFDGFTGPNVFNVHLERSLKSVLLALTLRIVKATAVPIPAFLFQP